MTQNKNHDFGHKINSSKATKQIPFTLYLKIDILGACQTLPFSLNQHIEFTQYRLEGITVSC